MRTITIDLPFAAMGKPRMTRRDKWAKRPCVVDYHEWAGAVRTLAAEVPPASEVNHLEVLAFLPMPKSWPKKKRDETLHWRALHRQKPDADNILKAVMDALWKDDSAIPSVQCKKWWATSGFTRIRIDAE